MIYAGCGRHKNLESFRVWIKMKTVNKYPKVKSVKPLDGKVLLIEFENGVFKYYNCNTLLDTEEFRPLLNNSFFKRVQPDPHGYGVIWSDEIDLAESELWINGETA